MKNQQEKILQLLRHMGHRGVNSFDLTYIHSIKQAPTRIKELKEQGYSIVSRPGKNKSVTYILLNSPASNRTTEPQNQPWQEELVPVTKNGYIFWEKPKQLKQEEMNI